MKIQGKYNSAEIFTPNVDEASLRQLYSLLNHPGFAGSRIAVMPDVHMGLPSCRMFTWAGVRWWALP